MEFIEPRINNTQRPKNILIVDDEAPIRLLVSHILRQAGYEVLIGIDGIDAARHLNGAAPIDLLLTDVSMPGMNGVELARLARKVRPGLPVLFVSGSLDCFPDTCHDVPALSKPFTPIELTSAVEALLPSSAAEPAIGI